MRRIIQRIKGFDPRRMIKMIKVICDRSGKSFIHIFLDIFRCWIKFGSGYMDYYLFYFETLPDDVKASYINIAVNKDYIRHCNDPKYYHVLNNKVTFLNTYKEFIKRDYIDIRECSYEEYEDFYNKHEEFMAKPIDGLCGYGIELIKTEDNNPRIVYDALNSKKQFLLEERIKQNAEINQIYDGSINTLRIVTLYKNNNVKVLFRAMRIGNNGKVVDNFNNGGLMAVVDADGVIRKPVLDKENKVYTNHPMTNTPIVGFKIPHFDEVIELCKKLAKVTPQLGLCGWDIAVTDKGVDVVEGNEIPGYDIYQSREQLAPSVYGLKKEFDDAIYPEKKDKKIFGKGHSPEKFFFVTFVGIVIDYLFSLIGLPFPITFIFMVCYLFFYKHIDTRSFKKTMLYIFIVVLVIFTYQYFVDNYTDLNNFDNPTLLYYLKNNPLDVLLSFIVVSIEVVITSLICMYFIFPIIGKLVEKMNKVAGYILTVLVAGVDILFIAMVLVTYLAVAVLLFEL